MENIKISEISEILRKQLEGIDMQVQFNEIGEVIEVKGWCCTYLWIE